MWVFALEVGIAVLLLLGIVWVSWPKRRDKEHEDEDVNNKVRNDD